MAQIKQWEIWRETPEGKMYVWTGKGWTGKVNDVKTYKSYAAGRKAFKAAADKTGTGDTTILLNFEESQQWRRVYAPNAENTSFGLTLKSSVVRKNPGSAEAIWKRTEERKKEGKRRAQSAERKRWIEKNLHRMQSGVFARNMIKALEIHPWMNSVEDWQRYFETKYAQRLRRGKRKNPCGTKGLQPLSKNLEAELLCLWSISKIHSQRRHERMLWVAKHFSKKVPGISNAAAYKHLDRVISGCYY